MITRYTTRSGSVYEVDHTAHTVLGPNRTNRLRGNKYFQEVYGGNVGQRLTIIWMYDHDITRMTVTSPVEKVEDL